MRIAIIGAGNIGGATARGLRRAGRILPSDISLTAATGKTLDRYAGEGFALSTDNVSAIRDARFVFLAVKPWVLQSVIGQIGPHVDFARQTIVTMVPGVSAEATLAMFRPYGEPRIAYFIPNTAIEVCEGMDFLSSVSADGEDMDMLLGLLEGTGVSMVVDLEHLAAATALASCGIAYAMRYIRASMEGGVELGLRPAEALATVVQTVRGASALLAGNGLHPEVEIDRVTTAGGVTIRGLNAMESAGFTPSVIAGLKAVK